MKMAQEDPEKEFWIPRDSATALQGSNEADRDLSASQINNPDRQRFQGVPLKSQLNAHGIDDNRLSVFWVAGAYLVAREMIASPVLWFFWFCVDHMVNLSKRFLFRLGVYFRTGDEL